MDALRTVPRVWKVALLVVAATLPTLLPSPLARFQPLRLADLQRAFVRPFDGNPLDRVFVALAPPAVERPVVVVKPVVTTKPSPRPSGLPNGGDLAGRWPTRPEMADAPPAPPGRIDDPYGELVPFYSALARTALAEEGAVVRISHYGDSPVTGDLISGDARQRLQALFEDGGPGFVLAAPPWEWYQHRGVKVDAAGWEMHSPWRAPGRGGRYGFGGTSFWARSGDARSVITTSPGTVSRYEIHYLGQPGGGTLLLSVDDQPAVPLSTTAPETAARVHVLDVPDGKHSLTLRTKGDGEVAVYGVALERSGPGLVYDALGCNGASVQHLRMFSGPDFTESVRLRRPDLVILNYGTNESGYGVLSPEQYAADFREVIARIRAARPEASILVMAPMDRAQRGEDGQIATLPSIPKLVEAQRRVARKERCAFFDTWRAMGGEGTMARWFEQEPRLVTSDLTHPTGMGADRLAQLLVTALVDGFRAWQTGTPLPAPSATPTPAPRPSPSAFASPAADASPEPSPVPSVEPSPAISEPSAAPPPP